MAGKLKFGNRFQADDLAVWEERWRGYFRDLHAAGFVVEDTAYRHFAAEVFHDSQLRLSIDAEARAVTLYLINTYAFEELGCKVSESVDDLFLTSVQFTECKAVEIAFDFSHHYWYQCAELSRLDDAIELLIGISLEDDSVEMEVIRIVAKSIHVSDISGKLIEQFGPVAKEVVTPIRESPLYYLQREPFRL